MGWLSYVLVYGLTWPLAMLPRGLQYAHADVLAFLLCHVVRYRRGTVIGNLRRSFPDRREADLRHIAWGFYRNLGDIIVESAFLLHGSRERLLSRCEFTNLEVLSGYYREGRSVIIAAAHYTNWEFLTTAAPHLEHHMLSIYKPIRNQRLLRLITRSRERLGCETVRMQDTLRTVLRYAQQGRPTLVGLISDQTPWNGNHYWGRFLNQDTLVFRGIEHIAKRIDAPVLFCDMQRTRRGYYRVHLELITDKPRETKPDEITSRHLAALERCIIRDPSPWLWSHRRWKYRRERAS